jgi:hypothetical protein
MGAMDFWPDKFVASFNVLYRVYCLVEKSRNEIVKNTESLRCIDFR